MKQKFAELWKELIHNKSFCLYLILTFLVILAAVFAPVIATHDPYDAKLSNALQPPSSEHWFGTDTLGRDLFSRVIYGSRISISSALILVAIIFSIGTVLGIIAGACGGIIDVMIMRLSDIMIAFPDMILAMAIAGILGPSLINSVIAVTVVSWTKYARLSRSLTLKIKGRDFIQAARITGSKPFHIIWRYYMPNVLPTMVITAATDIGTMMLSLASLSFLGFGVQPPTPEWGYMMSEGRSYLQHSPQMIIFPGLAIFCVVSIFNLLGDGFRDILDPKSKVKKTNSKKIVSIK